MALSRAAACAAVPQTAPCTLSTSISTMTTRSSATSDPSAPSMGATGTCVPPPVAPHAVPRSHLRLLHCKMVSCRTNSRLPLAHRVARSEGDDVVARNASRGDFVRQNHRLVASEMVGEITAHRTHSLRTSFNSPPSQSVQIQLLDQDARGTVCVVHRFRSNAWI